MVDTVAIIVAALALLGTLAQAVISGWINFHSEDRKRRDQLRDVIAKYRDPLCRATEDLSYKLFNIVSHGFALVYASENSPARRRSYAIRHTSYVFGQFFAWVHILRHDTQFLMPPDADPNSKEINKILGDIRMTLLTDSSLSPFMLWSGEQLAISEIMIVRDTKEDGGQVRCMGFATFCQRWKADEEFRAWFAPIEEGLAVLSTSTENANSERLQSLQHLLVDLLEHLTEHRSTSDIFRCLVAPIWCSCKQCKTGQESAMGERKERGRYAWLTRK
ncbi:hypothetical protein E1B28_002473 [Marasmius oreades]|uniref:Uncharacterized protein n=1 Tax=Marasmius oreades TaxID=181124 RepID=A0A9P7UN47_9AGAR|nr:uncharacterized protein E1B28_002473 [Marasmius oreades]KAG7086521.1 hypothetical protein E1B28_002473 [Marasmius oreades]